VVSAPDIPGHRVTGVLGSGGFATVYQCWQLAVGREVAVKVDNRVLLSDRDRRRFYREVHAAGRLSGHPHVINIYDAGTLADGRPYMVMELCPAGSLNDALQQHGPMPPDRVRDVGIKIADALAAAHQAGVLHRDIKPANILINRYGLVGLSDFGLASIIAASGEQTASREALTPAFASPETFRWEEPTALADVYSLAATLYALLSGRPPRFPAGGSPGPATIMRLHDMPVDDVPGASPELLGVLRAGLATDPAARPPGAAALRDALLAAAPGAPGQQAPPPRVPLRPAPSNPSDPTVNLGRHAARPGTAPGGGPDILTGAMALDDRSAPSGDRRGHSDGLVTPSVSDAAWAAALSGASGPRGPAGPAGPAGPRGMSDLLDPTSAGAPDGLAGGPQPGAGYSPVWPEPPETGYVSDPRQQGGPGGPPGGRRASGSRGGRGGTTGRRDALTRGRLALAGLLAVLVGLGVVVGLRFVPHGGGTGANTAERSQSASPTVPSVFGIPVTARNCPAAAIKGAGARCPAQPECWNGLVVINGATTIQPLPCARKHVYQTFAIAILPQPVQTFYQNIVGANKLVKAVCATAVMMRSRTPGARRLGAPRWEIDVLPPSEAAFNSGAREYRCIARLKDGTALIGSAFVQ